VGDYALDGRLCIRWEFNIIRSARNFVILEDGYLYKRGFRQLGFPLVKIDCFYNKICDDEQLPYILK
jgi:hypothetical protein